MLATAGAGTELGLSDALAALGSIAPTPALIRSAYSDLHGRLKRTYRANFAGLTDPKTYVDTFRPEQWRRQAPLREAAPVMAASLTELPSRLADVIAAIERARLIAPGLILPGPVPQSVVFQGDRVQTAAAALLRDVGGPFGADFERFLAATLGQLDRLERGKARLPAGVSATADFWYQAAWVRLLVQTFALEALFAALPARELWDFVDGQAGARAAGVKIGGCLQGANGRPAEECDLMSFDRVAVSLEGYVTDLWEAFGVNLTAPQQPRVRPYAELAFTFVIAELGKKGQVPLGLQADHLADWEQLPSVAPAARIRFTPTWPMIVEHRPHWILHPATSEAKKREIMAAEPRAQLGLFVAATLYQRSSPFLFPAGTKDPPDNRPITINAGSLEFGGKHFPHDTHRSGTEIDLNIQVEDLRRLGLDPALIDFARILYAETQYVDGFPYLEELVPPKSIWADVFQKALGRAFCADKITKDEPFDWFQADHRPRLDFFATPADTAQQVARARAFCLSILLSGATRLLFGDPWVFIDSFRRLDAARAELFRIVAASGAKLPEPFAWPHTGAAILEPFGHHDHWHAQWRWIPVKEVPCIVVDVTHYGYDIPTWMPIWRALGMTVDELLQFLDWSAAEAQAKEPADALAKTRKLIDNDAFREPSDLPDLFQLVYGGNQDADRALLENPGHAPE